MTDEVVELGFPENFEQQYPEAFALAWAAVETTLATIHGVNLEQLARHSPTLRGFDWIGYLRCSAIRMVRALDALWRSGVRTGRILDFGSYFGNAALMCRAAGYDVDAYDGYTSYGSVFANCTAAMRTAGIRVIDAAGAARVGLEPGTYDAVLCLGVVEHIPHTPRLLL